MQKIIGITGSIGSGKTAAAHIMQDLGAYIINADIVARLALLPTSPIIGDIREKFGDDVMIHGCVVDRRRLAKKVFSDKKALETLNSITHPYIKSEMMRKAEIAFRIYKKEIVVFDAPLLIEAGLCEGLSDVWLITAPLEERIRRIIMRDRATREEALARINARVSDDELKKSATVIINNDGSYDELRIKITETYNERYKSNEV